MTISIMNISTKRCLQVFSAFLFFFLIYFGELCCLCLFISLSTVCGCFGKCLSFCYLVYFYMDRKSHESGSRNQGCEFTRNFFLWRYFTSYFPMTLVKTVDLPPAKNYIFAMFPHGVMSASGFGNFSSSTTGFAELFPKIRSKFCTLNFHFLIPFFRDLFLSWGMISVKSSSIKNALLQSNDINSVCNRDGFTSNAVVITVGGSQEVLSARPGSFRVVLKNRKGFIKLAITTGASVVPVFSFGENEIYNQPHYEPGSKALKFQECFKKVTGTSFPLVNGRGFFQYSYGIIPKRHPITTVVGSPVEVVKNETPTAKEIDDLHNIFICKLKNLFDDHKKSYVKNFENVELIIE